MRTPRSGRAAPKKSRKQPSPDSAPVTSPDGNTVSIDVGNGKPDTPPALPDDVVGRLATALAEQRNLTETLREFAHELGKLLDDDTAAIEHFKRGMIAAGVGYVQAYHVRGLRLLAAKRALESQARDDDDRRDAIIGVWEDEQSRRQGVTPRTIRQWIHEAEFPSEWWQALVSETARHVKATVPRPPPSISRFFKSLEKETRREPEEDLDDAGGPSILDGSSTRTPGGPDANDEPDNQAEDQEDVDLTAEAGAIRNLVTTLLTRETRALDDVLKFLKVSPEDEAIGEEIQRLRAEMPNIADYIQAMEDASRLKEENERLRTELEKMRAARRCPRRAPSPLPRKRFVGASRSFKSAMTRCPRRSTGRQTLSGRG